MLVLVGGALDLGRVYAAGIETVDGARVAGLYLISNPPPPTDSQSTVESNLENIVNSSSYTGGASGPQCASLTVTLGAATSLPGGVTEQPMTVVCSVPLITTLLPIPSTINLSTSTTVAVPPS